MLYKKKIVEVVGTKEIFGQKLAWIKILADNSFLEVNFDELEEEKTIHSLPFVRFIAIAAKIKEEVAKKNILAP